MRYQHLFFYIFMQKEYTVTETIRYSFDHHTFHGFSPLTRNSLPLPSWIAIAIFCRFRHIAFGLLKNPVCCRKNKHASFWKMVPNDLILKISQKFSIRMCFPTKHSKVAIRVTGSSQCADESVLTCTLER